jgi:aminocarboxymuconate-semialdehyde decarboxylase
VGKGGWGGWREVPINPITSIDVHFHVMPPEFVDAVRREAFREAVRIEPHDGREMLRFHVPAGVAVEPDTPLRADLYDDRLILDGLNKRGLDAAAVGPPPTLFFYWTAPETGERIARTLNDGIAALVRAHPDRFFGLGTLPMQDGPRAARELERVVNELGFRGIELCTQVAGMDLDHPSLTPVWVAAERLGVPFFLHPQNWGDVRRMKDLHLWNLVGFPMETALTAARLILGGVFERHPGLRVILAHGGGYFPYQIGRLDHGYAARPELRQRLPRRPSEYLESIYCDSLTHSGVSLRFLLDRLGDDHVVIGSDYPFDMGYTAPVDVIRGLGLGRERETKVLGKNLARLLRVA